MSSVFDSYGKCIRDDGVIVLSDPKGKRLFWSKETQEHAGEWVTVVKPKREATQIRVLVGEGDDRRAIDAHEMLDVGFYDIEGARETYKRLNAMRSRALEAKQASIVAGKIVALVQLVDQRIEDRHIPVAVLRPSLLARAIQSLRNLVGGAGGAPNHRVVDRQLKLESDLGVELGLSDAVVDHALAVFEFPDTFRERVKAEIASGHRVAPAADGAEPSEADQRAHRLCGGAK